MSYSVGHRRGSDLALPRLWCRLAGAAPIRPLAWEPPHVFCRCSPKKKKKKKVVLRDSWMYSELTHQCKRGGDLKMLSFLPMKKTDDKEQNSHKESSGTPRTLGSSLRISSCESYHHTLPAIITWLGFSPCSTPDLHCLPLVNRLYVRAHLWLLLLVRTVFLSTIKNLSLPSHSLKWILNFY